ncbi:FkbM family methyltransferase [Sulfuritalea sp.]|uniref:FkbM family methyltransferase n=1 Tax=Sulfuritalea sp. TaxID=2480090 RepID=UPI001AC4A5D6|nr:FkbM family methyltransferase [Sulfuritalea sp.]MBN8474941.1 FkbM family methyltransferase [Sulfuritalea sp.]
MHHDLGEEVVNLLRQGYFEAAEQAFFWLYLRPGDTFIDCGAHIGLYSILAAKVTNGETRVVAIEPNARTAKHLIRNLKQNNVSDSTTIRAAVWKTLGKIRFLTGEKGKAAYDHVVFDESEAEGKYVSTLTLDKLVSDADGNTVALVKIDVEGSEIEALIGGEDAIAAGLLPVLMVEFTESNLQRRGLSTEHLYRQLVGLGYTLCEFRPEKLQVVPFNPDGPIWYKNLFACADVDYVNSRLAASGKLNQQIATDVLQRAAACTRFKELENLEYFKQLAEQVPDLRHRVERLAESNGDLQRWAEGADAAVVKERALSQELRAWAERIEGLLTNERKDAEELRKWAQQTAAELDSEHRISKQQADKVRQIQSALTAQEEASRQLRVQADRTDAQLVAERENSKNLQGQLRQVQSALTAHEEASRQLRVQADRTDAQLVAERENSKNLQGQLSQVQSALTAQEEASRQLRVQAERSDARLVAERENSKNLQGQLSQGQSALTAQEEASRQLRAQAERSDARLVAEIRHSAKLQDWAKRSDEMLFAERETSRQLREWAESADSLLAKERLDNAQLKSIVNSRRALLKRLILWKPFLPGWCRSKVELSRKLRYWPVMQLASFKSLSMGILQRLHDGKLRSPALSRKPIVQSSEVQSQTQYLNKSADTQKNESNRDLPQCISELEHAFRTDPSNMSIVLKLGMVYESIGSRQRALQLLQRVARSGYKERTLAEQCVAAMRDPKE